MVQGPRPRPRWGRGQRTPYRPGGGIAVQVRNLMKVPVVSIEPDRSVREAAQLMQDNVIGSVVVQEGGRTIGIMTERDVLRAVAEGREVEQTRVDDLMTKNLVSVGPNFD